MKETNLSVVQRLLDEGEQIAAASKRELDSLRKDIFPIKYELDLRLSDYRNN